MMEVDTGASALIIGEQELSRLFKNFSLRRRNQRFRTYTDEELLVKGIVEVLVETENKVLNYL